MFVFNATLDEIWKLKSEKYKAILRKCKSNNKTQHLLLEKTSLKRNLRQG